MLTATSTASGHHVVDLFDATASPAEIAACSLAIMRGNVIRFTENIARSPAHALGPAIIRTRSQRAQASPTGHALIQGTAEALLPGHRSFQDHCARRHVRLHAVFRGNEDFKILVRG